MNVEVTKVQFDAKAIEQKVQNIFDDSLMTDVQRVFAETIDPWTPYRTGRLHSTLSIDAHGVTYDAVGDDGKHYAARKYYGEVYTKDVHPLATSHWDKVAMQTEMPAFEAKVKELIVKKVNELYG